VLKVLVLVVVVVAAACGGPADDNGIGGGGGGGGGGVDASAGTDSGSGSNAAAPGGACSCDGDCPDVDGHDGVCIYGVCMTEASAACASGGSTAECPTGSQCWNLTGRDGSLCWPECAQYDCAGTCAMDGTCEPNAQTDCDPTCGNACSCTATSCGADMQCVSGECVPDVGAGPGAGPGPACASLPVRDCTTGCNTITTFAPRTTAYYDDYPINGETTANQYRSWARKDLIMLMSYATAFTECKSAAWTVGNGGALGLGDMSEMNGAIPGTSIGSPGHPAGTHVNGYDIDIGYYQVGTADNKLREICPHTSGGQDAYHCTGEPTKLDVWRTALFLGALFSSTRTRVVGVDGKAGPLLMSALQQLCDDNWLTSTACNNISLAFETTNQNQGWYYFHHHHSHLSLNQSGTLTSMVLGCQNPYGCDPLARDISKRPRVHRLNTKAP
jgi:hypothetical protein